MGFVVALFVLDKKNINTPHLHMLSFIKQMLCSALVIAAQIVCYARMLLWCCATGVKINYRQVGPFCKIFKQKKHKICIHFPHAVFTRWFSDSKHKPINHPNKWINLKFYNVAAKSGTRTWRQDDMETCKWVTIWIAQPCHCIQKGEKA